MNHTADQTRLGVLLCINGTGILNAWTHRNITPEIGYAEMNDLAASVPIGSEGVTIIPFGNGAERVLENKEIGCSINGVNFNKHHKGHLVRAAQEGIVFSFCYGLNSMTLMVLLAQLRALVSVQVSMQMLMKPSLHLINFR